MGQESLKHHRWHWQQIRRFFKPVIIKLLLPWFAIIPIVLSLTAELPHQLPILGINGAAITLTLPFKWWLLWWASVSYSVGFAIYLIQCPAIIKRYPSYASYLSENHSPRWLIRSIIDTLNTAPDDAVSKLIQRLRGKGFAKQVVDPPEISEPKRVVEKDETVALFLANGDVYEVRLGQKTNNCDEMEREIFWEVFGALAASHPKTRFFTWLALGGAGFLLLCAVAQNILTVLDFLSH